MDLSEYKELYLKTATDLINQLKEDLPRFLANQLDLALAERIHRNTHSLKSQSLVMGYQTTGMVCKEIEFFFRAVKDGKLVIAGDLASTLADSVQKLYDSIESIKNTNAELDLSSVSSGLVSKRL
jgi:chemotaxis protein histidine kinase CheA